MADTNRTQIPLENLTPVDGVDGVTLETAPAGLSAENAPVVGGGEEEVKPRTVTGDGIREVDPAQFRTSNGVEGAKETADGDKAEPRTTRTKNASAAPENKAG